MPSTFHALPGFYRLLFLYFEPLSTFLSALLAWTYPGAAWFHQQLIPTSLQDVLNPLDARTTMAMWQLANCFMLLSLISSLVFRAVRDALPQNPQAQERIVGASLAALAIADVTHVAVTLLALPNELRFDALRWNSMTHGNITFVVALLAARLAWFMGIGRRRISAYKSDKAS